MAGEIWNVDVGRLLLIRSAPVVPIAEATGTFNVFDEEPS
jgi:hypothetical protein